MRTILMTAALALPIAAAAAPAHAETGITAKAVDISSPSGNHVKGELIGPSAATASHPGVLFVHWLGEEKSNHEEFEADATALAERGATSVLIDAMWAEPKWFGTMGKSADADVRATENQLKDIKAALDYLMKQPGIDPARVAYVGHDFGAMFGALLSKTDARPRYYVLMAGTPVLSDWYLFQKKIPNRDAYVAKLGAYDILGSLKASKANAYLFQFSAHDFYISAENEAAFFNAAPLPRGVFYYDTDHALAVPAVFRDRQAWLADKLFGK